MFVYLPINPFLHDVIPQQQSLSGMLPLCCNFVLHFNPVAMGETNAQYNTSLPDVKVSTT